MGALNRASKLLEGQELNQIDTTILPRELLINIEVLPSGIGIGLYTLINGKKIGLAFSPSTIDELFEQFGRGCEGILRKVVKERAHDQTLTQLTELLDQEGVYDRYLPTEE